MSTHLDPHKDNALWSQYLDGDLESAERKALEAHLRECEICRDEVQMMRKTVDWLSQLAQSQTHQLQAPEDFEHKVRKRLRTKRKKRRVASQETSAISGQTLTTALIFATLIVLAFTLLLILSNL